jgi:hypothetical protein
MGLHFKTDNDFAIKISEYLLDTDEYKDLVENIKKELNV